MTSEERLAILHEILTDPCNQLEQTRAGYYIYRFNLETMHRIADAIGIEPAPELFVCYRPEELGRSFDRIRYAPARGEERTVDKWIATQDQMPVGSQFVWALTSVRDGFPIIVWTDGEHFYAPLLDEEAPQYADDLFAFWASFDAFTIA